MAVVILKYQDLVDGKDLTLEIQKAYVSKLELTEMNKQITGSLGTALKA